MEIKLENKSDYIKAITDLYNEIEQLKLEVSELKNARGFKFDPITKMSPNLAAALKKARSEFLPLQKTGVRKKDGELFAKTQDYEEATRAALQKNNLEITFTEDKGEEPLMITKIIHLVTLENYTITTKVKPANMPDPEKAIYWGFNNAKGNVYKTISQLS